MGVGWYSVQKILLGRAANMDSKINLLVYQCNDPLFCAEFGI